MSAYPPSIVNRIAVGKAVGAAIGAIAFVSIPWFWPEAGLGLQFGVFFWYTTLGAIIGVYGVFDHHPLLGWPFPWQVRAPLLGAWMNFVLTFFAWEKMEGLLTTLFGANAFLNSPLWFVVEGAIVGFVIGYFATRFGGEGEHVVDELRT